MAGLALAGVLTPLVGGIQYALAIISFAGVLAAGGLVIGLPETRGVDLDEAA
jgi:hypothetical protein